MNRTQTHTHIHVHIYICICSFGNQPLVLAHFHLQSHFCLCLNLPARTHKRHARTHSCIFVFSISFSFYFRLLHSLLDRPTSTAAGAQRESRPPEILTCKTMSLLLLFNSNHNNKEALRKRNLESCASPRPVAEE